VRLRLPTDLGAVFLSRERPPGEYHLPAGPGKVLLSQLSPESPRARPRGAAHEAFRKLYALPFDTAAVTDFRADVDLALEAEPPAPSSLPRWAPWVPLAAGAAALAVSGGLVVSAHQLKGDVKAGTSGRDLQRINDRMATRNRAAAITGATGGALVLGGLGWLYWQGRF
jgi:hypothetical protein